MLTSILVGILMIIYRICMSYYYNSMSSNLFIFQMIAISIFFIYLLFPFKLFFYLIRKRIFIQLWRAISPIWQKQSKIQRQFIRPYVNKYYTSDTKPHCCILYFNVRRMQRKSRKNKL